MSVVYFKIGGNDAKDVDATNDVTTDAYEFINSNDWSVSIKDNSVVGLPTYTLEVSNNGTQWYTFSTNSTSVALADSVTVESISYRFVRIVYEAKGASSGTVDIELSMKSIKNNRG